jgi:hypothetical protein
VDWSLSYFDGFDLSPDIGIDRVTRTNVDLLLRHHRIRVIGADAAATIGPYGLRGEAAYTFTEDPAGNDPFVKNPFFFLVVGADRRFPDDLGVNLQYIFRTISAFQSRVRITNPLQRAVALQEDLLSNQLDEIQHAVVLRINKKWLNQTLEAESTLIFSFTRLDYVVRPKLTYALTDRWKVTIGGDIFGGPHPSLFNRLEPNTVGYVEFRWSF